MSEHQIKTDTCEEKHSSVKHDRDHAYRMLSDKSRGKRNKRKPEKQKIIIPQHGSVSFCQTVKELMMVHPEDSNDHKAHCKTYKLRGKVQQFL